MRQLLATATALAFTVIATQANAASEERWPRWYVGLSGGTAFLDDTDLKGLSTTLTYDMGYVGTVSVGYMPNLAAPFNHMRVELEGGYHYNQYDTDITSGITTPNSGSLHSFSLMGNLYYDFRNQSSFTPYLGAGIGGARVSTNNAKPDDTLAYQFMGGVAYTPSFLPMTEWSIGYRYFTAQSPDLTLRDGSITFKFTDVTSHNAEIGARLRF